MPSVSTKVEPAMATDPAEFSKSVVVMMEKKIRNLEKRKGKLEDYRSKQNQGQTLNDEQQKAVAKLDDVLSQIELLQDLTKQVHTHGTEVVKQQKRQQKRERFEQIENERKRFGEVLHLQTILNALGEEDTRQAFSEGSGGAVKLEEQELNHLDELYKIINPDRGADASLAEQVKSSSEHLQHLLDGRDKAVCGTTYRQLSDLLAKIKDCSYFIESAKPTKKEEPEEVNDTSTEKEFVVVNPEDVPHPDSEEVQSSLPPEVPAEQEVASEEQVYQQQQDQGVVPSQPPADPKTFEEIVENVQGRFNFLQDSELDVDSPSHVDPAVVSVHTMPTQHYQQQTMVHSQPENSTYMQQANESAAYQQYNMPSAPAPASGYMNADGPQSISLPNETPVSQAPNQPMYSSQVDQSEEEHHGKYGNGMTFESSALKQDKSSHPDGDYQQRGQGQMRRGGGQRGGRGYTNGYAGRGGFRGADRSTNFHRDRQSGGDRTYQSGNGFQSDNRRGGGRNGPRGGSGGYRGGSSNTYSNSNRGRGGSGYRGQQQQQQQNTNV